MAGKNKKCPRKTGTVRVTRPIMDFRMFSTRRKRKAKKLNAAAINQEFNRVLAKECLKKFKPTLRDMRRPMKPDEMKQLCQRIPCRVDMHRWNPVFDYLRRFYREGRLRTKTYKSIDRLLAKAVNRHKKLRGLYKEQEIERHRALEKMLRKKDHLLRLRLWEYDKRKGTKKAKKVNVE